MEVEQEQEAPTGDTDQAQEALAMDTEQDQEAPAGDIKKDEEAPTGDTEQPQEIAAAATEDEDVAFPKTDASFLVEGKELHVSSQSLKNISPVFREMFESDLEGKSMEKIELPGLSYQAVVEFLKCSLPYINAPITVKNVLVVLPLADKYETMVLKHRCEVFILEQFGDYYARSVQTKYSEFVKDLKTPGFGIDIKIPAGNDIDPEKVTDYLLVAEKYGLSELVIVATWYIALRNYSQYDKIPKFSEVSLETKSNITKLRLRMIEEKANVVCKDNDNGCVSDCKKKEVLKWINKK